jgi:transposase
LPPLNLFQKLKSERKTFGGRNKMRFIGVDLHTTQVTVCYLKNSQEYRFRTYQLSEIEKFVAELEASDEIAVEATGNTRWFVGQVEKKISRIVIVNPREFEVIKRSVKKTDKRDALNLARFLAVDMLPEVRQKSEQAEMVQRINETRTKFVRLKTTLMNKIHALAVSRGRKLKKESLSSKKGLKRVFEQDWTEAEKLELEIIVEQIEALNKSIKRTDAAIEEESRKLEGFENIHSITGIGARSAGVLLAIIGDVKDFADEKKLASYFGIVPKVANSNEKVNHGRITKRGSKTGRTTLVQCTMVAIRYNEYLRTYYERIKARRGHGKAKIATARKYLGIIYNTLKNEWVFEDFNNFVLAE